MTTGKQLLEAGFVFAGQRYSTASGRTNPDSDYKDCSGFVYATHLVATGKGFPDGATVSTSQEIACRDGGGRKLSRDEAMRTPGAICFIWGFGSKGHVELSAGDGRNTYGTPSDIRDPNARDVGYTPWANNAWETYWSIPGIDYGQAKPKPEPIPQPVFMGGQEMFLAAEKKSGATWIIASTGVVPIPGDVYQRLASTDKGKAGMPHVEDVDSSTIEMWKRAFGDPEV